MSQQQITDHREGAEIYSDANLCKQKSLEFLKEIHLRKGILPLDDIQEIGYNRNTGFVWLKQRRSIQHIFKAIKRKVCYDTKVTAFVEDRHMGKVTGVKSQELLVWVSVSDISVDEKDPQKITFGTPAGLKRVFPLSAFESEGDETQSEGNQ